MTNAEINKHFLSVITLKLRDSILSAIAAHYGITKEEALEEVTDAEAELLVEYLTGPIQTQTYSLMKGHCLF